MRDMPGGHREAHPVPWADGRWSNAPATAREIDDSLVATAEEASDAWRHTAYGFVHDSAHGLLAPLQVGDAMEVSFHAPWTGQFDQAGILVRSDEQLWAKAGVEYSDGHLGLGAVVTDGRSDWSIGYVDHWRNATITVRVSRWKDALVVRARATDEPWRLVRVAPYDGDAETTAGPLLAAPTRAGLTVTFTRWVRTDADASLH